MEFSYAQFFSKSMPFLDKIGFFLLFIYLFLFFFIFLWICIPQLPPNVVSHTAVTKCCIPHCCHQMLCTALSRLNVVNWIKKMIIEGGGVVKKMIFGGFIHPCYIGNLCSSNRKMLAKLHHIMELLLNWSQLVGKSYKSTAF